MFLRTVDLVTFRDENDVDFVAKRRKGNIIKKFTTENGDIKFTNEELVCKLIPKKDKEFFNGDTVKIVSLENGSQIIFQDFSDGGSDSSSSSVYFLSPSDDGGFDRLSFYDLDYTKSVVCYDDDDYVISEIDSIMEIDMCEYADKNNVSAYEEDESGNTIIRLSNYVIHSDKGIVVNDILLT